MNWQEHISGLQEILRLVSVRDASGKEIEVNAAFIDWTEMTCRLREEMKTVYLIGNGASASMASHISADLAKNAHVHTEVFSDLSLITAIGNDLGFEEVFAEPLRRRVEQGDMVVAISSSGRSPNILRACREARNAGATVVTLSAMDPENRLRREGSLNFYLSANTYGTAETCHAAVLHYWLDRMVLRLCEEMTGEPFASDKPRKVQIHGTF